MNNIKYIEFFKDCLSDLECKKDLLIQTEYIYAKQVIIALSLILQNLNSISAITSEKLRNQKITHLTKLIAEPGLFPGNSQDEVIKSIITRISQFQAAYLKDLSNDETLTFFKEAFLGPPCFNGRLITLQHYIADRQGYKPAMFYEYKTEYDAEAVELEEIMYDCIEEYQLEENKPPSMEKLSVYLSSKNHSINLNQALYARACEFFVE